MLKNKAKSGIKLLTKLQKSGIIYIGSKEKDNQKKGGKKWLFKNLILVVLQQ